MKIPNVGKAAIATLAASGINTVASAQDNIYNSTAKVAQQCGTLVSLTPEPQLSKYPTAPTLDTMIANGHATVCRTPTMESVTREVPTTTYESVTTMESVTREVPTTTYESVTTIEPVTIMKSVTREVPVITYKSVTTIEPVTREVPTTTYESITTMEPVASNYSESTYTSTTYSAPAYTKSTTYGAPAYTSTTYSSNIQNNNGEDGYPLYSEDNLSGLLNDNRSSNTRVNSILNSDNGDYNINLNK